MKAVLSLIFSCISFAVFAQDSLKNKVPADTTAGFIKVIKDPRLEILAKKEAEFNSSGMKSGKGYRLMVISSNDRAQVMKVRAQLLQLFPEQKVYMTFQAPYIKIKFGNFVEKADADKYRQMITKAKIVTNNVYMVPETIEIKPDKNKDENN